MKKLNKLFTILTIPTIIGGVLPITLLTTSCSKPSTPPLVLNFGQITLNDGRKIEVPNAIEFNKLCDRESQSSPLTINGTTFIKNTLTGFAFGHDFNLESIGNYFLSNCTSFNHSLVIPSNVTSIGTFFLSNCHSFNQSLIISSTVSYI